MIKNYLDGITVYLSGPIQYLSDSGIEWRKQFAQQAKNNGLNFNIIDPTDKKGSYIGNNLASEEIGDERFKIESFKKDGRFEELTNFMKLIRRWDLRAVDASSCIILNIDPSVPTWGTVDEIILAEGQQKPIFAIIKGGAKNAPNWLFPIISYREMFENISSCISYLKNLNIGEIPLDNRWVFFKNKEL